MACCVADLFNGGCAVGQIGQRDERGSVATRSLFCDGTAPAGIQHFIQCPVLTTCWSPSDGQIFCSLSKSESSDELDVHADYE